MAKKKSNYKKLKRPARLNFLSYIGDTQGCGTIRIIYPYLLLNHYIKKDLSVNAYYIQSFIRDPLFYKNYTFVQFQRSATKQHFDIFQYFRQEVQRKEQVRVPIVYEIDDLLINIPEWNFAADYYAKNFQYVEDMLKASNAIICSTPKLKEIYGKYNKNIKVVLNHLPKFIWGHIYPVHNYYKEGSKIKILWAGSQNHFALPGMEKANIKGGDFGEKLIDFIRKTTNVYDWHLMGGFPVELKDVKDKIKFIPWQNIFNYPRTIKDIEPDICIAPLEDNVFNSCKSNIKMLEYTACGSPGVYSNVEPYKKAKLKANTDEEMISHIEALANDIDLRVKVWSKDREIIREQLWWEENQNVRKYIETYLNLFGKTL